MSFATNYNGISNSDNLLPEGKYECIIKSAFVNATSGGTVYYSVQLIIRNDVPGKYHDRRIYHRIWMKKEINQTEDDKKIGGFSYKQIMNLCRAAGLENGKSYESLDDLGKDLEGKCVLVTIGISEYNGSERNEVKWINSTKYPDCKHRVKETEPQNNSAQSTANEAEYIEMPDDGDLPF